MSEDVVSRIAAATARGKAVTFVGTGEPQTVSWSRLHDDARRWASAMQAQGVGPGGRVAILGATSRPVVTAIQGAWLAGAAVIVLPLPMRVGTAEDFRTQSRDRVRLGDAALTVSEPDLVAAVEDEPGDRSVVTFSDVERQATRISASALETPSPDPDATAILQFTSGSTADPKGVVIPHRCVLDNLDAARERAPMDADHDVVVSWCPLYHDMGLVYNAINAMIHGTEFVVAPPTAFVSSPGIWMEWMSAFGGTWSIGPNFGFAVAARFLGRADALDLSRCLRMGSGSEPVESRVMEAFASAGARHGLDGRSMYAAYGMAEATVAISIPPRDSGFTVDTVDGDALEHELRAEPAAPDGPSSRVLARCGPPLRGMELRVVDPDSGTVLDHRCVGEIEIRGPSVVPGYFRRSDATAAAFREGGWLRTGDQGYLAEGDVVICGRLKDVIIVGGRNVFPEDLERAVQGVPGVRPGNVIAFGVEGGRKGDAVVVVAEVKEGEPSQVRAEISRAVRGAVGLRVEDVVLLAPGQLPKTSSGKLRRSICRARYQSRELEGQ
jgi:fatty-acyl-CoA synthase